MIKISKKLKLETNDCTSEFSKASAIISVITKDDITLIAMNEARTRTKNLRAFKTKSEYPPQKAHLVYFYVSSNDFASVPLVRDISLYLTALCKSKLTKEQVYSKRKHR